MKKRLLSLALVLVLCLSLLPTTALAAGTEDSIWLAGAELSVGEYLPSGSSTVQDTKPTGGYAYLEKVGSKLILHLNDYENENLFNEDLGDECVLYVDRDLTIQLAEDTENVITNTGPGGCDGIGLDDGAALTITGGGSLAVEAYYAVYDYAAYDYEESNVVITDTTVSLASTTGSGLYVFGTLTVEDSDLTIAGGGGYGIFAESGMEMSGSTLEIEANCDGIGAYDIVEISDSTLTIKAVEDGIVADYDVVIAGSTLEIEAGEDGIYAYGDVEVSDSTLTIEAGRDGIDASGGQAVISDTEAWIHYCYDLGYYAIYGEYGVELDGVKAQGSEDGETGWVDLEDYDDRVDGYEYVRLVKGGANSGDVYVGGVGLAVGDYLPSGSDTVQTTEPTGGYAHLEDVDGVLVLTLKDYDYEGEGYWDEEWDDYRGAVYTDRDLTVMLEGENSLYAYYGDGVHVVGDLTIDGDGTLTIETDEDDGINVYDGDLDIEGGEIEIDSNDDSIYVDYGDATIKDGEIEIDSGYDGIYVEYGELTIEGGQIEIDAYDDGIYVEYGDFVMEDGELTITTEGDDGIDVYSDDYEEYGGNAEITGGTIEMTVDDEGFNVTGDFILSGGALDITAGDDGIDSGGEFAMSGGTLTAAGGDHGIIASQSVTISGGAVYATGGLSSEYVTTDAVSTPEFEMTGGYLLAKNVGTDDGEEDPDSAIMVEGPDYFTVAEELSIKASRNSSGMPEVEFDVEHLLDYNYIEIGEAPEGDVEYPTLTLPDVVGGLLGGVTSHAPFADVLPGDWYYDAVADIYGKGLMNGTGDGKFSPHADTSRAMIVTILWRLEGSPMGVESSGFADNDLSSWYGYAVEWAAAFDIVEGADGKFMPNDPITREQLAAILFRYAKYKGIDVWSEQVGLEGFKDVNTVSGYAAEPMQWAVGSGLIQGANNSLMPGGNATRAQVAAILSRFLG